MKLIELEDGEIGPSDDETNKNNEEAEIDKILNDTELLTMRTRLLEQMKKRDSKENRRDDKSSRSYYSRDRRVDKKRKREPSTRSSPFKKYSKERAIPSLMTQNFAAPQPQIVPFQNHNLNEPIASPSYVQECFLNERLPPPPPPPILVDPPCLDNYEPIDMEMASEDGGSENEEEILRRRLIEQKKNKEDARNDVDYRRIYKRKREDELKEKIGECVVAADELKSKIEGAANERKNLIELIRKSEENLKQLKLDYLLKIEEKRLMQKELDDIEISKIESICDSSFEIELQDEIVEEFEEEEEEEAKENYQEENEEDVDDVNDDTLNDTLENLRLKALETLRTNRKDELTRQEKGKKMLLDICKFDLNGVCERGSRACKFTHLEQLKKDDEPLIIESMLRYIFAYSEADIEAALTQVETRRSKYASLKLFMTKMLSDVMSSDEMVRDRLYHFFRNGHSKG